MVQEHLNHLKTLDCEVGATLDELKLSFKSMSFIWHPDRQPLEYQELAKAKIQKINAAWNFFRLHPERLQEVIEATTTKPTETPEHRYRAQASECLRCAGGGKIATDVDSVGRFIEEDCPICEGQGHVVVDERNTCQCCEGSGQKTQLHDTDREQWIDTEMRKRGWIERHLHPLAYKKMWLRYQLEVATCSACDGSGYFFVRPDQRRQERRKSSYADFLHDLQGKEQRLGDDKQRDRRSA